MNTKTGFRIREVCGEKIIVAEGKENIDFSNIISMNDSAAYLWNSVEGKEFTIDTIVKLLLEIYDVDEETAKADSLTVIRQWADAGIIEGDDIPVAPDSKENNVISEEKPEMPSVKSQENEEKDAMEKQKPPQKSTNKFGFLKRIFK